MDQKQNLHKQYLIDQLKTTYNEKGWLVPFTDSVKALSAKDAASSEKGKSHSVWGIVDHLIFWNGRWLTRLKGGEPPKMETDNSATFDITDITEEKWNASVSRLTEILKEILEIAERSDDNFLSSEAFPGYGASWYEMFAQYTLHNAYHTGQIVQIRKEQGSWNADYGIKG